MDEKEAEARPLIGTIFLVVRVSCCHGLMLDLESAVLRRVFQYGSIDKLCMQGQLRYPGN